MTVHPIFTRYCPFRGLVRPGFTSDWLGVLVEERLFAPNAPINETNVRFVEMEFPDGAGPGTFDLIAICKAVDRARDVFTMFELGAGYGYWLTQGTAAALQRDLAVKLVGVEAEPTHYQMMLQHLRNNNIDPTEHAIIEVALAPEDGEVFFRIGNPLECWGQSVLPDQNAVTASDAARKIKAISLGTLLLSYDHVNVIHMDIQGLEFKVIDSCADLLDQRAETLIIGTHGKQIEEELRRLLRKHHWVAIYDFAVGEVSDTPHGLIAFEDGVQIWENSRLV
jgi:FkbM family methyltransferase